MMLKIWHSVGYFLAVCFGEYDTNDEANSVEYHRYKWCNGYYFYLPEQRR